MSEKCHTHLVTLIKHHGIFVPYIVYIFAFENLDLALHTCQPIQGGVDENHLVSNMPRLAICSFAGTDAPRKLRQHHTPTLPSGHWSLIRHSRNYTIQKIFDSKKCPVHLAPSYRLSNITVYSFHTLSPIFFSFENLGKALRTSHPIQVL